MEVDVRLPNLAFPSSFVQQDICSVLFNLKISKALVYFLPKYSLDQQGRDELYADIRRSALVGGDNLTLWGLGRGKHQVMHIRCQCGVIYRGSKVDKETGSIINRTDYRHSTYRNDRKNQRHGQKGRNASHRTSIERRLTKNDDCCPFSLAVFQDKSGYYMSSTNCKPLHQYHPRRDSLRASCSLLTDDEYQLQDDLNSARAKLGAAVNLHYVRSARQGTPTVLTS